MSKDTSIVLIKNLALDMSIGIHAHEKANAQRVLINLELSVDYNKTEHIDDVICYESIITNIQNMVNNRHFNLVEELAEEIAALCLKDNRTNTASVQIEKPDIFEHVGSVGIRIIRS